MGIKFWETASPPIRISRLCLKTEAIIQCSIFSLQKRCGVSLDKLSREITNKVTGDHFCLYFPVVLAFCQFLTCF